jgi:hypothetical protein
VHECGVKYFPPPESAFRFRRGCYLPSRCSRFAQELSKQVYPYPIIYVNAPLHLDSLSQNILAEPQCYCNMILHQIRLLCPLPTDSSRIEEVE